MGPDPAEFWPLTPMQHYRNTFLALALLLVAAAVGHVAVSLRASRLHAGYSDATRSAYVAAEARKAAEKEAIACEKSVGTLRQFAAAWEPQMRPARSKDLGNSIRAGLTSLATRAGLTSEGATVAAEPRNYAIAGHAIKVQQVSLNVVGESLPAVITWLGAAEEQFAYARVESLALSAYGSHSVQLSVTLLHPSETAVATPAEPESGQRVSQL